MSVLDRFQPRDVHPVTPGRVLMAKVLASICSVAYCFAIVGVSSAASLGESGKLLGVIDRGSTTAHDVVFALACFAVGFAAMASAIHIRHGMGRPVFEPRNGT